MKVFNFYIFIKIRKIKRVIIVKVPLLKNKRKRKGIIV